MYLYNKNNGSVDIYSFSPDKEKIIEFKKKYLEYIKSVILHINSWNTTRLIFDSSSVMFEDLDRNEFSNKKSYIEVTNNEELISRYINGDFDNLKPLNVIGDKVSHKSLYSGELMNQDCTLLIDGGHGNEGGFVSNEGILLTNVLNMVQPLLSGDINNLRALDYYNYSNNELMEFINNFKCVKEKTISLDDLDFLQNNNIINFNNNINDIFNKSEIVLNCHKRVRNR